MKAVTQTNTDCRIPAVSLHHSIDHVIGAAIPVNSAGIHRVDPLQQPQYE
jgi:hypothetical protein